MSTRRVVRTALLLAFAGSSLVLGACGGSMRRNPTPELMTMQKRSVDVGNDYFLMRNENWRMAHDDLTRMFLIDRASRLEAYPIGR